MGRVCDISGRDTLANEDRWKRTAAAYLFSSAGLSTVLVVGREKDRVHGYGAPSRSWQVYVVPVEGGTPRMLSPEGRNHTDPSWSPDGLSLAFGAFPGAQTDIASGIFILDLKTNRLSKVVGSERMFSPRWSPDGRYINAQTSDGLHQTLFDSKTQRWQELTGGGPIGYPNWSRDGKYIYYDAGTGDQAGFYRVRTSDHKVERLANLKEIRRTGFFDSWAGLAPDDSPLLLRDTGTQEIYALDVDLP